MNPRVALLAVTLVGAGLGLRALPPGSLEPIVTGWWPFARPTQVTLYFRDGTTLFPVSRQLPFTDDLPRAAVEALLEGPRVGSGLTSLMPSGLRLASVSVSGGAARVEMSSADVDGDWDRAAAETALVLTLTSLPGVSTVELSLDDRPAGPPRSRTPLLFYASREGLKALPSPATSPDAAVAAYLAGPADPTLVGLPRDVRLSTYEYNSSDRTVALQFTYTDSTRMLAIEKPDIMRSVLLGLIASLTEFPEVEAVQLDFGGQSRLGLGECSDLLRTRQPRPRLLNDERLVGP